MRRTKLLLQLATQKAEIDKNTELNTENFPKNKYLPHNIIYRLILIALLLPRVRSFD